MKLALDKYFNDFNKSIVVLANPKTVLNAKYAKKEVKDKVIRADQIITHIKNIVQQSKEIASNDKDLKARAESILGLHTPITTDYIKKNMRYSLTAKPKLWKRKNRIYQSKLKSPVSPMLLKQVRYRCPKMMNL